MKYCSKCGILKDLDLYYKSKKSKYGLASECKSCTNISNKRWAQNNKLAVLNIKATYRNSHKKEIADYNARVYKESDKLKNRINEWKLKNPEKLSEQDKRRKLAKFLATPDWLNQDQKDEINQFYKDAKDLQWLCEERLNVDHIIPLQGELVSGLHVPWNLRIITAKENLKKFNKLVF